MSELKAAPGRLLVERHTHKSSGKIKIPAGLKDPKSKMVAGIVVSSGDGMYSKGDTVFYNQSAEQSIIALGVTYKIINSRIVDAYKPAKKDEQG